MSRVRACAMLLALLPACLDFPDAASYLCDDDSGCPAGWECEEGRCFSSEAVKLAPACRDACDQFYDCGAAEICQGDETCVVQFLHEPDADACTAACTADSEGFTESQLSCIGNLSCADSYAA